MGSCKCSTAWGSGGAVCELSAREKTNVSGRACPCDRRGMVPSRAADLCLVCWKGMQGQQEVPDLALTVDGRGRFRVMRFSRQHGGPQCPTCLPAQYPRWASSWPVWPSPRLDESV